MTVEQIIEHLNGLKLHCEDIAKLKDVKADKCDIPDPDSFNHLFDDINKNHKKLENQVEEINKRLDNIYSSILNKDNNNEDINGQFNQEMLQGFVIKDDFECVDFELL